MASRFLERLASGPPIVGDGGMGTLVSAAVPRLRCPEEANLRAPESVVSLHLSFVAAGAELIETNTFGANRRKLAALYLEDDLERILGAGVKLAREAREIAGQEVFVAGSIGPLGEPLTRERRVELFAEQARTLDGRGVDLFTVETFFDLDELEAAIEAVRSVSSLPIVAMLTFDEDGETPGGVTAATAAARLAGLDLAARGANHGAGPQSALEALTAMRGNGPLAAFPNLGLASRSGGRIVYPHSSGDYFAEFAAQARDLGARLIGGCCGTTPAQIAAIRTALAEARPAREPLIRTLERGAAALPTDTEETVLARKLAAGEWVVSVELDPPKGGTADAMLAVARRLKESGRVDVVDVNDNAHARARMNPLMASVAIEQTCDLETIPHLTPRDTTVIGLESVLLGAHAAGVRNVLAVTGDPPEVGDYAGSSGVYEIDSIGLCRVMQQLNRGESYAGKAIDAPTSFHYGVAVNPSADDLDLELRRFEQKLEAGASFAMTQSLFDLAYLDRFVELLGGSWPIPALLGVFYVTSYRMALHLHNEVPGIIVPQRMQERLRDAPAAAETGLELARELAEEAREKVAGIYVIPPFKQPEAALDVIY